jgi:hypothetical protein
MRAALAIAAVTLAAPSARAEPLPAGSIGVIVGAISGTGADANNLGYGWFWGGQAAWQPMNTDQRVNISTKWTAQFGRMYGATASRVNDTLYILQMDLTAGIRIRPGVNPSRYITLRGGGALLRSDQVIPPKMYRAFAGAVATVGMEQYIAGWLLNVDVRYGLIGTGPTELGLVIGFSKTGG